MTSLFEQLQKEFCPPLDSSLLAALIAELESDGNGNATAPNQTQIKSLRANLTALAAQAEETQIFEFTDHYGTEESTSTLEKSSWNLTASSSGGSESSTFSAQSFSSPLGFLHAVLPHVPSQKLKRALSDAEPDDEGDVDMWEVVAQILSEEWIQELRERGWSGVDGLENPDDDAPWNTVAIKPKPKPRAKVSKRKAGRKHTFPLLDVRQQHHVQSTKFRPANAPAVPDPWNQLTSIASSLAALLPPNPPSFFLSHFHSPQHSAPCHALRAALDAITSSQVTLPTEEHNAIFFNILDILLPENEHLDAEQRSRLLADVELCLKATLYRGDDALDLVNLLRELEEDSLGRLEMGVYHTSPTSPIQPTSVVMSVSPPTSPVLDRWESIPPVTRARTNPYEWQHVPSRTRQADGSNPLANQIPSYANQGHHNNNAVQSYQQKARENRRKHGEMLKEASKMWQRGSNKTRGGEIAFYFAERARGFQEKARLEALNAARARVELKSAAYPDRNTLDMHGTTAAEAITIVRETLQMRGASDDKPLKIVTGRGSHSANQVSVLKPAIKKALEEEGWLVGSWDAGLVIRGRRT